MKAIGYIRVSTEEQSSDDRYGIEVQKDAISKYAKEHDYDIVDWMVDTSVERRTTDPNSTGYCTIQMTCLVTMQ